MPVTEGPAFDRWTNRLPANTRLKVEQQVKTLPSYCPNLDNSHTFDDLRFIAEDLAGKLTEAPDSGVATCPK